MATAKKTTAKPRRSVVTKKSVSQAARAPRKVAPKKVVAKKAPITTAKRGTGASGALAVPVYDATGKKIRTLDLPADIFAVPRNDALLYQVVVSMEANARTPVAHAKDRGAVRGGGRKPWKQKGTGRARHGSRRSPIWKGGGVTHGPLNVKNYSKKLNRRMRAKALAVALSQKLRDGEIMFVDGFGITEPKTKNAKALLGTLSGVRGFEALSTRRNNAALIALGEGSAETKKSFRNMGNVFVEESRNLNPVDLISYRFLVIADPETTLKTLAARVHPNSVKK